MVCRWQTSHDHTKDPSRRGDGGITQAISPDNEKGFNPKSCLAAADHRATLIKYRSEEDHT